MPYGQAGTDMQLRRPDMEQMLNESKREPRLLRRRGCVTCLTFVIVVVILVLGSALLSAL